MSDSNPIPEETGPTLASTVGSFIAAIGHASPGDAAMLRRVDLGSPFCSAFWKLAAVHLEPRSDDEELRWAILAGVFAHAGSLHRSGLDHSLGRVLQAIDFSELRFNRLLRASGDPLLKEALLLGRLLAAKAHPVDLTGIARLVLSDGRDDAERVRRQLARDYFGAAQAA